jgi:glycosyltransferase involved in cell wall biosynthesis
MAATGGLARILDPVCRFVYKRAALVLGQSEGMAARLVERGVPPERADVFFNWADEEAARANGLHDTASLNFERRFNFVYAGNLGAVQALEVLIEAAQSLEASAPHIQLTLIGEGAERAGLEALVRERGVRNVQIVPGVPPSHIGDVLAAADVLVVHLKDDPLFEITIPSKTQFYLAMGKPILIGVSGEAARIVTEAGAGIVTPPENSAAMAEAMLHMAHLPQAELDAMGERGRATYQSRFAFKATMDRIAGHVDSVLKAA